MVLLFNSFTLNRLLLCGVLTTFSMAVIAPPPAYAEIGLNDVAFWIRMEKLIEKMWRYKDRLDSNKILDTMFEIKVEVEQYLGEKIDIDQEFNKAKAEIKRQGWEQGVKISDKDFEKVRKTIKKKEKKIEYRAMCMASYLEEAPSMSFQEYELLYRAAHDHNHGHNKDKDDEEMKEIPLRLSIGITMVLAGGFLCIAGAVLKMPVCIEAGKNLASAGVAFAVEGYVNKQDENKEKDKDKR